MQRACATGVVLAADEIGKNVLSAPAFIAECGPVIVVCRLSANVDEAVDRTRSAERPAPWPIDPAALHRRLRVCEEAPVQRFVEHRLPVADGKMNPQRSVLRTRFEQQDLRSPISRKLVRKNAAGGAAADDDIVALDRP